jgi:N-methylhydantoinase A/oxoprolinase/acetone carboxylase beta subunit
MIVRSPRRPGTGPLRADERSGNRLSDCITVIPERVDDEGDIVVELDKEAVEETVRNFIQDKEVEPVAVCYLWCFQRS